MGQIKTARIEWQGEDLQFLGTLGSGYEFKVSSPATSEGGSPMEFLLAGVAGCTAMDIIHILRKKRQLVDGLIVEISGERAEEHPQVYTKVDVTYVVRGEGIATKAIEDAIQLSQDKYCSASILFKQAGVQIHTDYRIEPVS